jgi:hypothetical protein
MLTLLLMNWDNEGLILQSGANMMDSWEFTLDVSTCPHLRQFLSMLFENLAARSPVAKGYLIRRRAKALYLG